MDIKDSKRNLHLPWQASYWKLLTIVSARLLRRISITITVFESLKVWAVANPLASARMSREAKSSTTWLLMM